MRTLPTRAISILSAFVFCLAACSDPTPPPTYSVETDVGPDVPLSDECSSAFAITPPEEPQATPNSECPHSEWNEHGICQPQRPNLVPNEGCPGALTEQGTCAPEAPRTWQWDCPPEWERQLGACLPPTLPDACPPGQMAVVGQSQCVSISTECPEQGQRWHDEQTLRARASDYDGRLIYVHVEAKQGGDGSTERPLPTIAEALEMANRGDIIALGSGQFDEEFTISKRIALIGSCAEQTAIATPSTDNLIATVRISSAQGGALGDLTITGARPGIGIGEGQGAILVRSVHVHQAVETGVFITGERVVSLEDVRISDTRPPSLADPTTGRGLRVQNGSTVTVTRGMLDGNHDAGVLALGPDTLVELTDVTISNTQPRLYGQRVSGRGVQLQEGATVKLTRAVVNANHNVGIIAAVQGTVLEMTDVLISNTQPQQSDGTTGRGLQLQDDAMAQLTRVVFDGNHDAAVFVTNRAILKMNHALITNTQLQQSDMTSGWGISVRFGSFAQLDKVTLNANHEIGILIGEPVEEENTEEDTVVEMNDILISNTMPRPDGMGTNLGGRAIHVMNKANVLANRVVAEANHEVGILVEEDSELHLTDVRVSNTLPVDNDLDSGWGMAVQNGATLTATRGVFDTNHVLGVVAQGPTSLVLDDILISNTQPKLSDGNGGQGLHAQGEAVVTVTRCVLDTNHEAGAFAEGLGTQLNLSDIIITNTQSRGDGLAGWGLGLESATAIVNRAEFDNNHEAGAIATHKRTRLEMTDVRISNTQPKPNMHSGWGVAGRNEATVIVTRSAFDSNHEVGAFADNGARLEMTDVRISNTQPRQSTMNMGWGLAGRDGATVMVTRGVLNANHEVGVFVEDDGSCVELVDTIILDTQPRPNDRMGGRGLQAQLGAKVTTTRARIDANHELGAIALDPGTVLTLNDTYISNTRFVPESGSSGGLGAQGGALVWVNRAVFDSNQSTGVVAFNEGTQVVMIDVTIQNTQARPDGNSGIGLSALKMAHVDLERFQITQNALIGLQAARQGQLTFKNGTIDHNHTGLNPQDDAVGVDLGEFDTLCVSLSNNCCETPACEEICNLNTNTFHIPSSTPIFEIDEFDSSTTD